MNNTTRVDAMKRIAMIMAAATMVAASVSHPAAAQPSAGQAQPAANSAQTLSQKQQAIAPISAATAVGDMPRLNEALNQGLDAGLTLSETKEILVQMYAYAGFPRSLNALGELMKVVDARKQRGIQDAPGREPGSVPKGQELLELGTANQTKLVGAPVRGALFEFSPVIDEYLKSHLFGAIFARDNLDWQSRELATVGALAALPGAEPQL
jgi:4-carboxymuconolactone decarboxylase